MVETQHNSSKSWNYYGYCSNMEIDQLVILTIGNMSMEKTEVLKACGQSVMGVTWSSDPSVTYLSMVFLQKR